MSVRRLWMIGAGCAFALIVLVAAIAAEDDQLLATVDRPAILTATPAKRSWEHCGRSGRPHASSSTLPAISRRRTARFAAS